MARWNPGFKTTASMGCGAILALILFVVALGLGLSALSAWIFSMLWNWLVPDLFHGPAVTFWQAWGIMILLGIVGSTLRGLVSSKN